VPLSHAVAEWLNDPFARAFPGINLVRPAGLPGQGGNCIINFETGDPLEALLPATWFTEMTNGTVYHCRTRHSSPGTCMDIPLAWMGSPAPGNVLVCCSPPDAKVIFDP
jgi:hypothetical protein